MECNKAVNINTSVQNDSAKCVSKVYSVKKMHVTFGFQHKPAHIVFLNF